MDRIGASTSFAGRRVFTGESRNVLTGPNPGGQATRDIPALSSVALGGESGTLADLRSGGAASVTSGNAESAGAILQEARHQILFARAKLGAFERHSIDAAQRLFEDMTATLSSSLSRIADADVALESANLVKALTLADSTVATARLTATAQRASASLFSELLDAVA